MAKSSLSDLPDEIIQEIFSKFCQHCHNGGRSPKPVYRGRTRYRPGPDEAKLALLSLCLTSRRIYANAAPILYHEFSDFRSRLWSMVLFLRTISQRPDLAGHVKSLTLAALEWCAIPQEVFREFGAIAARLGFPSLPEDAEPQEEYTIIIQLILAHTPRLQTLGIACTAYYHTRDRRIGTRFD